MKTEEEKKAIRAELGTEFFMRIAQGACPYCTRPLVPPPPSWPTYGEALACTDCVAMFGMPESGGDGIDDLENMKPEGGRITIATPDFVARWQRGVCPSCEKPLATPSRDVFPDEILSTAEFVDAKACNDCPRLLAGAADGYGIVEWTPAELRIHAVMPGSVSPTEMAASRTAEKNRRKRERRLRRR